MQNKKAPVRFIEKCYRLYEQKMYQVAYGILHDSGLAEDAVQNAFMKLMKSNVYFEDVKSDDCKRYMITVIKHSAIDIYKIKHKESELSYLSDKETMEAVEDGQGEVSETEDLKELIEYLPSKYYAVVDCLVVRDMTVKETAGRLGITEANVRKRFERAKIMLKNIVKGRNGYENGEYICESGNL